MKKFGFILCFLVVSLGLKAQKTVFTPTEWSNTGHEYYNRMAPNRMAQSDNFVMYWGDLVGTNPTSASDANLRFNPTAVLDTFEFIFKRYITDLKFINNSPTTNFGRYKTPIIILGTFSGGDDRTTGFAHASSYSNTIGAMFVHPTAVRDGGAISHEYAHALQMMMRIQENPGNGRAFAGYDWAGAYFEGHANYMRAQVYQRSANIDLTLTRWIQTRHLMWSSHRHHYTNYNVMFYVQEKEGFDFTRRMWAESANQEHPFETIKRLKSFTQEQLNDYLWGYAAKDVAFDYPIQWNSQINNASNFGREIRNAYQGIRNGLSRYTSRQYTFLNRVSGTTDQYFVNDDWAPQDYGMNIIPLYPTCTATEKPVKIKFKGHTEVNTAAAGWRYGFVTTKADGTVSRYSPMFSSADGEASFTLNSANEANIFFVVFSAPRTHYNYNIDVGYPKQRRYPYELKITNANPEGYQTAASFRSWMKTNGRIHSNGGGWISNNANVATGVYVGPYAIVRGGTISGNARIEDWATVEGGNISGNAIVRGNAYVYNATIAENAVVEGNAWMEGGSVRNTANLKGNAMCWGASYTGTVVVGGDAEVPSCSTGVYLQPPYWRNGRTDCDGKGATDVSNIDINPAFTLFSNQQMALAVPSISGVMSGCLGSGRSFSASTITGATSYQWLVPTGWTVSSGQGSTNASITFGTSSGIVTVLGINACATLAGFSPLITITGTPLGIIGSISGAANVCSGTLQTLSIGTVVGAQNYRWTVPSGFNLISGQGSNSVSIQGGTVSGLVSVVPFNGCVTGTSSNFNVSVVNLPVNPASISGLGQVCSNAIQTYSCNTVVGAQGYVWTSPSGSSIISGQGSTAISLAFGTAGGVVSVKAFNSCGTSSGSNLNVATSLPVNPTVTALSAVLTVCSGISVTITATSTNGGTNPTIAWFRNNAQVSTGTTYNYIPSNSDAISARLTAGGTLPACLAPTTAVSNLINLSVTPASVPNIAISSSVTSVCSGTGITLTATSTNGGTNPTIAWFRNNAQVSSGTTYNYVPSNGDAISARLTAGGTLPACLAPTTAVSNLINLSVTPASVLNIAISSSVTSVCSGTGITLTATSTNGGTNPTIAWFRNNAQVSSGTTYNYVPSNGDAISARLTAGGTLPACLAPTTAVSNLINLTVRPASVSNIAITSSANSVCSGTGITLTATSTNGGTNPTIAWFRNNAQVSSGTTYNYVPSNGDAISARLTAGGTLPACLAPTTAVSNLINLSVTPASVPNIAISSSANSVCSGTGITLTATSTNGGTNPTIAWFRNNAQVSSGTTYNYVPSNGDAISARLTAGGTLPACLAPTTAVSNLINLTVNPLVNPSLTIVNNINSICSGSGISISASGINLGSNPVFKWFTNNSLTTATGAVYSYFPLSNDQIKVTAQVGGVLPLCLSATTATSPAFSLTVDPCLRPQLTSISGPSFVLDGTNNVQYSVPSVPGDTYVWSLPAGVSIVSGQGTSSISLNFGNGVSGPVALTQTNTYGSAQVQVFVQSGSVPFLGTISGPSAIMANQTGVVYEVSSTPGTSYHWTVPAGAVIIQGQGSPSIVVDYGSNPTGNLSVTGTNNFGSSTASINILENIPTEVSSQSLFSQSKIYPNPSQSAFSISAPVSEIKVFNIQGEIIDQFNSRTKSSFGENYTPGVYILQIDSPVEGVKTIRLVKI